MAITNETTAYLGDGMYVSFDGYSVVLNLRAQDPTPENTIVLEPGVLRAFEHTGWLLGFPDARVYTEGCDCDGRATAERPSVYIRRN